MIKVYLIVVALYIFGNTFNGLYQKYQSLFLDICLFIIGILIAYFTVNRMYKVYYMEDKIRPITLTDSALGECIQKGMKQSRIEIVVIIFSTLIAIFTFITFFIVNSIKPLMFGSLSTAISLSFIYMKPLKRRIMVKKWSSNI